MREYLRNMDYGVKINVCTFLNQSNLTVLILDRTTEEAIVAELPGLSLDGDQL